jgi:hypothetical protein
VTAAPAAPVMPVPFLDKQDFDKQAPGNKPAGTSPDGAGKK